MDKSRQVGTSCGNVCTVVPQMNAREYNLSIAISGKRLDFRQYFLNGAAVERGSNFRNDAVRTTHSAAILDFDERPMPIRKRIDSFGQFRDTELLQKVGNLLLIGDDLRNAADLEKRIGMMRCGTAHHDNIGTRIFLDESSDSLSAFGFTFARDGAGIDNDKIGGHLFFDFDAAMMQKSGTDEFRLVLIDLAAESVKAEKHFAK